MLDIYVLAKWLKGKLEYCEKEVYKDNKAIKGITFDIFTRNANFKETNNNIPAFLQINAPKYVMTSEFEMLFGSSADYLLTFYVSRNKSGLVNKANEIFLKFPRYINSNRDRTDEEVEKFQGIDFDLTAEPIRYAGIDETTNFDLYSCVLHCVSGKFRHYFNKDVEIQLNGTSLPAYNYRMNMTKEATTGTFGTTENASVSKGKPNSKAFAFNFITPLKYVEDIMKEDMFGNAIDVQYEFKELNNGVLRILQNVYLIICERAVPMDGVQMISLSFSTRKE